MKNTAADASAPLIQNNPQAFIGSGGDDLEAKYNDDEEARLRLYVDADGQFYHPTRPASRPRSTRSTVARS